MRTFPGALSLLFVATALAGRPNDQWKIDRREIIQPSKNIIGVASIAGITNRNGRVSSITGVKMIPSLDSPDVLTSNESPFLYPLTVTKEANGKFASGSIQFQPGSVIVSSTAGSGYGPDWKMWPKMNIPLPSDIFLQTPLDIFDTPKSIDPWFPKDIFKPVQPPQISLPRGWLYPHFNPFINLWR